MSTTTTYDVLLRYRLDNQASKAAEHLRDKLHGAAHASHELSHALAHVGAIAGGVVGIHGAWKHLVEFNKEVEDAKISLTAMVEGGFGGSFQWARGQAETLFDEFQKFSQQTPLTTKQMLEFSRSVAMGVQGAGGSIKDIINVTEQGAVAAKAYGFEASLAGREITEMLQGNIRSTEPFTKALANAGHKTLEELRAMTAEQRLDFLKSTLNAPALKDAVAQMSTSFSGVTSTLIDKLEILMGKIGLPLFKAITAEVTRWNEWIDKNEVAINEFSHTVAHGLVQAFSTLKDVFAFIWEHSDVFIAIGKVWAGVKLANMAGGALSSLASGIGGLGLGKTVGAGGAGGVGLAGAIGPMMFAGVAGVELAKMSGIGKLFSDAGLAVANFVDPVGMAMVRAEMAADHLAKAQDAAAIKLGNKGAASDAGGIVDVQETRARRIAAFVSAQNRLSSSGITDDNFMRLSSEFQDAKDRLQEIGVDTSLSAQELKEIEGLARGSAATNQALNDAAGLITTGTMLAAEYLPILTDYQKQTLNGVKAGNDVFSDIRNRLQKGLPLDLGHVMEILRGNTADPEGKHKRIAEKPKVNVTIHRIEVQSDDPDRFVFGMVQSFRDAAKNPSSALATLREG